MLLPCPTRRARFGERECAATRIGYVSLFALLIQFYSGSATAQQQQDRELLPYKIPKPAFQYERACKRPTWQDIKADPVVKWAFDKAMHDTIVKPQSRSLVTEEGGWIYQCQAKEGNGPIEYHYDVVFSEKKARTTVDLQDATYRPHMPAFRGCRTVGTFHSHPTPEDRHTKELSDSDIAGGEQRGVPAFLLKNRTKWEDARSGTLDWELIDYAGWNENGIRNLTWRCPEQACGSPGLDGYQVSDPLPASAGEISAPVDDAIWNITNFRGQMVCGGFTIPLAASTGNGTIEVHDQGETLVGTGFEDGTAPITMHAVPGLKGRYSGSVGGMRDGIPMIINFCWQLVTDQWITGYLKSEVEARGVSCKMSRDFEMRSDGPVKKEPNGEIPVSALFDHTSTLFGGRLTY